MRADRLGKLGLLVGASAGWFHPRGYITLDASWDKSLATHVAPTAMHLRDYPGSGSGWYGSGGGVVRAGVAAGVDASRRIVIALRAGFDSSERLNMTPGLPFYAFVGGGARF